MSLIKLLPERCKIYRMTETIDAYNTPSYSWGTVATNVPCRKTKKTISNLSQNAPVTDVSLQEVVYFLPGTDIQTGDLIEFGGNKYRASEPNNIYSSKLHHIEVEIFLEKEIANLVASPAVMPVIDTQPTNTTKDVGQTATFTVLASTVDGGVLTYQWQKYDGAWQDIANATNSSYTTSVLAYTNNNSKFRCFVTNDKNNTRAYVNSNEVILTVNDEGGV